MTVFIWNCFLPKRCFYFHFLRQIGPECRQRLQCRKSNLIESSRKKKQMGLKTWSCMHHRKTNDSGYNMGTDRFILQIAKEWRASEKQYFKNIWTNILSVLTLTWGLFLLFSQILGWCVIVAMALFSLLTTCCASCQSKISHLQLMFWKVYAEKEKEQLEQTFQLYATKLSERNLKCFFEKRKPEVMPLPAFQAWEDASQLYTLSSSKQHYSTIHRLVEEGQKEVSEERETTYDLLDRREIP